jgi:hypothetical protein
MTNVETPAEFYVRLRAAQLHMELDRRRNRPSPDWVVALVEEGERRGRTQRDAEASSR